MDQDIDETYRVDKSGLIASIETALLHPAVKLMVGGSIFVIAILVLHRLAVDVSWTAVQADIAALALSNLLLALTFTATSFMALACYDVLAVHSVAAGRVPIPVAATAGAAGYAISNLLGFSWLTGAAVRARIYDTYDMDMAAIGNVVATLWFSFWLGIAVLTGLLLIFHPSGLGPTLNFSAPVESALGIGILIGFALLIGWLATGRRSVGLKGFSIQLPSANMALAQTAVAVLDLVSAALTLYVLLPPDLAQNFAFFFVVFVAAIGLGVVSHSPGGIGVFEATMIAGLGAAGRSDVLASLVLYRLVYYVIPFSVAVCGLALAWLLRSPETQVEAGRKIYSIVKPLIHAASAGIALMAGLTLLVSGSLPAEFGRIRALQDISALSLLEASHLIGSIAGVLLIIVARGLYRKQAKAWWIAMVLIGVGALATIAKGGGWEQAEALLVALVLLGTFRSAFYRAPHQAVFHLSWRWLIVSAMAVTAAIWIGFFAYSNVQYSNDLWWDFAWHGDAPRFLRASLAMAVILIAVALNSWISGSGPRLKPEPVPDLVRDLVAASPEAEAGLALSGDKRFLVSDDGKAFIAYADGGGTLIAKGDPVGDPKAGAALCWQLRELADSSGKKCAFYATSEKYMPTYVEMGFTILKIGEVARVNLVGLTLDGADKRDFRQARNRARRDGYEFDIIPARQIRPHLGELKRVSEAWLESKHGTEKGFALGSFNEQYLSHFDQAVMHHPEDGRIIAFANLMQAADMEEFSIDLMRYEPGCPGFVMDALFGELMLWGADKGFHWFSLGAAPLSGLRSGPMATMWNRIGNAVFKHGEHFYNFEGLRAFKQKFNPVWTPSYLAIPRAIDAPGVLMDVNGLVSGGIKGLVSSGAKGILR